MKAGYYKNVEYLWAILEQLGTDEKIELVARIMDSIRPAKASKQDTDGWRKLSGAWANDGQSAEDLIQFLRDNRNTDRQIDSLD